MENRSKYSKRSGEYSGSESSVNRRRRDASPEEVVRFSRARLDNRPTYPRLPSYPRPSSRSRRSPDIGHDSSGFEFSDSALSAPSPRSGVPVDDVREDRAVRQLVASSMKGQTLTRDFMFAGLIPNDEDFVGDLVLGGRLITSSVVFLKQQLCATSDEQIQSQLNNIQLRGIISLTSSYLQATAGIDIFPDVVSVHCAVIYVRDQINYSISSGNGAVFAYSDVFERNQSSLTEPPITLPWMRFNTAFLDFTNPEQANNMRVMWRKVYTIPRRDFRSNYHYVNLNANNVDPALNYTVSGGITDAAGNGELTSTFQGRGCSVFIDEFVNLCKLPQVAKHRLNGSDRYNLLEGSLHFVCFTAENGGSVTGDIHPAHIVMNTRINLTLKTINDATFY